MKKPILIILLMSLTGSMAVKSFASEVFTPSWNCSFSSADDFNLFTVIDANNDSRPNSTDGKWQYASSKQAADYHYSMNNNADDWLISPGLNLKAGKTYDLKFSAAVSYGFCKENLRVSYGPAATVEGQTTILADLTLNNTGFAEYTYEITPAETDIYYIGFYAHSEKDMGDIYVKDVSVAQRIEETAPSPVTGLSVVAQADGELSALLSFDAPSTTVSGDILTSIDRIEISRNGRLIHTVEGVVPEQHVEWTDNSMDQAGDYNYSIIVSAGDEVSEPAVADAFVGVDVPGRPLSPDLVYDDGGITMNWQPVTEGANGKRFNPDFTTYYVWNIPAEDESDLITEVKDATSYSIDFEADKGIQRLIRFGLQAGNYAGKSDIVQSQPMVVGAPYAVPFREGFAGSDGFDSFWTSTSESLDYNPGTQVWTKIGGGVDGDGSAILFCGESRSSGTLRSGKISLKGLSEPVLSFSHYGADECAVKFDVEVITPDGAVSKVFSYDYSNASEGWKNEKVVLDRSLSAQPYVMIAFNYTYGAGQTVEQTARLDNVYISDNSASDFAIDIVAPEELEKGENVYFTIRVNNISDSDKPDYRLSVSANEVSISSTIQYNIEQHTGRMFMFGFPTTPGIVADQIVIKATVESGNETFVSEKTINLHGGAYPGPENLSAEPVGAGYSLSWSEPSGVSIVRTEDFESYPAWSIDDLGSWTVFDGDKGICCSWVMAAYPGSSEAFAWKVFNYDDYVWSGAAHSGSQYLGALYTRDPSSDMVETYIPTQDWLISPLLPGNSQTVSFYARAADSGYPETFELLYSDTDNNPESFSLLESRSGFVRMNWTELRFDLPEGARYFAIKHTSDGSGFAFLIDDISFDAKLPAVSSYIIYRDGIKIGTSDTMDYCDTSVEDGSHTYAVTAVYDDGTESSATYFTASDDTGGIRAVSAEDSSVGKNNDVYGIDGRLLIRDFKPTDTLEPGLYIIGGKKVFVR